MQNFPFSTDFYVLKKLACLFLAPPTPLSNTHRGAFLQRKKEARIEANNSYQLMVRLRKCGAIPLRPHTWSGLVACYIPGTALTVTLLILTGITNDFLTSSFEGISDDSLRGNKRKLRQNIPLKPRTSFAKVTALHHRSP